MPHAEGRIFNDADSHGKERFYARNFADLMGARIG